MTDFRNNHYVPAWYQKRFLPQAAGDRKFFYLDLRPEVRNAGGRSYKRKALLRWGPQSCFRERDLYTTKFGQWTSTDVEKVFFGHVDREGRAAVEYFTNFTHPSVDRDAFSNLLRYMSLQKLRTPKGMALLRSAIGKDDKNLLLSAMQSLQMMHGAVWAECVWSLADACDSPVKFIVSDHPITVYNPGCFPASVHCRGHRDPDIRSSATHTLFPLSADKILILTNLSWVRDPYSSPLKWRPNPDLFRGAIFKFTDIQTGRRLSEREVLEMNYIIKSRAYRYIAAAEQDWLYPENHLQTVHWDRLGGGYLLMPDPRSVSFTNGIVIGYNDGHREAFDEYGRRPGQPGYRASETDRSEWNSHLAFKGEFARVFGPTRRGAGFEFGPAAPPTTRDSDDLHAFHLRLEARYKPKKRAVKRYPKYVVRPED